MKREIWLSKEFSAVAEDGRLVEYLPETGPDGAGDILSGRVERIMKGMNCAFTDIGRKRPGILPLQEKSGSFTGDKLRSGDTVPVQIRSEERGEKGALLSRDLTLPGRTVILMPMNRHIGVSGRVTDPARKEELRALGREIAGDRFGLVLRFGAEAAEPDAVQEEAEALFQTWQEMQRAMRDPARKLLWHPLSVGERLLQDYEPRGVAAVYRDTPLTADLLRQLREAENRRIQLPHGGNIVIDRCEALTVIDVNSGSVRAGWAQRATHTEINLEACREIAIQARLRNLAGALIIDMINMDADTDRNLVQKALEEAFREDRQKTVVHGFTHLGLLEVTRRRGDPDLYEREMTPCPACKGSGWVRKKEKENQV